MNAPVARINAAISTIGVASLSPPEPVAAGRGTTRTCASADTDSTVEAHPPVQLAVVAIVHVPTHCAVLVVVTVHAPRHDAFDDAQSPMHEVVGGLHDAPVHVVVGTQASVQPVVVVVTQIAAHPELVVVHDPAHEVVVTHAASAGQPLDVTVEVALVVAVAEGVAVEVGDDVAVEVAVGVPLGVPVAVGVAVAHGVVCIDVPKCSMTAERGEPRKAIGEPPPAPAPPAPPAPAPPAPAPPLPEPAPAPPPVLSGTHAVGVAVGVAVVVGVAVGVGVVVGEAVGDGVAVGDAVGVGVGDVWTEFVIVE